MYALIGERTPHFNDEFVRGMDERNRERMACLPPWAQRHVIWTYGPREGQMIQNTNKYFSGVVGGVRKLIQSGLTEDESNRMIALAQEGVRLSYMPCVTFGSRGACVYGDRCKNVHIRRIVGL